MADLKRIVPDVELAMGPLLKVGGGGGVVGTGKDLQSLRTVQRNPFLRPGTIAHSEQVFVGIATSPSMCLDRSTRTATNLVSGPSPEAQDRRARDGKRSQAKVRRGCRWRLHALEHRTRGCPGHAAGE